MNQKRALCIKLGATPNHIDWLDVIWCSILIRHESRIQCISCCFSFSVFTTFLHIDFCLITSFFQEQENQRNKEPIRVVVVLNKSLINDHVLGAFLLTLIDTVW